MIDRDHPLSPAKGIINAVVAGLALWVLLVLICAATLSLTGGAG